MLKQAEINFTKLSVAVDIYNKKISEINEKFNNSFDLVVSLGNTFTNINSEEIEESIEKVIELLKKDGTAIIQILNYDKVLSEKERIVNITESNQKQFIKFYDFCGDRVYFNILSYYNNDISKRDLITTEIFPYTKSFLQKLFTKNCVQKLEFYGDMSLTGFNKNKSQDLMIIIYR